MRLEDYIEQVGLHVKEYLPKELRNAELLIRPQRKNNELLLHGLAFIIPDQYICPVLYLENYYQAYQNGAKMEDTFYHIGKDYLSALRSINMQGVDLSYEHIKADIFPCVVNAERNRTMLKTVPYQKMEDLAILYRCMIHELDNRSGSILVNDTMLDGWKISQGELHNQALKNIGRVFTLDFQPMETVISKLLGFRNPVNEFANNESGMYVLTNKEKYYGASYLCCPDILKWVSDKIKGNFLVLPSSINELVILKEIDEIDLIDIKGMVEMSNVMGVSEAEYLSDNIYRYDGKNQTLSMITENELQQGMSLLQ